MPTVRNDDVDFQDECPAISKKQSNSTNNKEKKADEEGERLTIGKDDEHPNAGDGDARPKTGEEDRLVQSSTATLSGASIPRRPPWHDVEEDDISAHWQY